MLRLLRKGLANHNEAFLTILYLCAGVHILLGFAACFIQGNDTMRISMNVPTDARVICMPSFMTSTRIPRAQKHGHRSTTAAASSPQKKAPVSPKKSVTQKKQKTTTLVAHKKAPLKTHKKSLAKPAPKPEPKVEPKAVEPPVQKIAEASPSEAIDQTIYVTQDAYQAIGIARELQTAIAEHWAPPAGMPSGLVCQVRVSVNQDGKATQLEVLEKSGVAVFDMAARTALLAIEYPQAVRGKTVVVDFNEDFL